MKKKLKFFQVLQLAFVGAGDYTFWGYTFWMLSNVIRDAGCLVKKGVST